MNSCSLVPQPRASISLWRDCIAPKEHGSWSLAFEPLVFSLLIVPTAPGCLLALAFAAGFLGRRPLRLIWSERRPDRRGAIYAAFLLCVAIAALSVLGTLMLAGGDWTVWLAPVAIAGGVFAYYDTRGAGREEAAEVAGSAAFALAPAAFGILGGWAPESATALAVLMTGRSVPSVLFVRAYLRAAKTGVRRDGPALVTAGLGLATVTYFHLRGSVPLFAAVAMLGFFLRALTLLVLMRPGWRARRIGMIEAVLGILFVAGVAANWRT